MESEICYVCDTPITEKNVIGLNKKLLGRNITKFYCRNCLAESFEITIEELNAKIEEFKAQGCTLFE
jgi:hypothetical protein